MLPITSFDRLGVPSCPGWPSCGVLVKDSKQSTELDLVELPSMDRLRVGAICAEGPKDMGSNNN